MACQLLRPWLMWRLGPLCSQARRAELSLLLQPLWPLLSWWNYVVVLLIVVLPKPLRPLPSDGEPNVKRRLRRRSWRLLRSLYLPRMKRAMAGSRGAPLLTRSLLHLWRPFSVLLPGIHHCSRSVLRMCRLLLVNAVARHLLRGTSCSITSNRLAIVNFLHQGLLAIVHLSLGFQLALLSSLQPAFHIKGQLPLL